MWISTPDVRVDGADGFGRSATFAIGKAQHPCARDLVKPIAKRKTRPDPDERRLEPQGALGG
jgi:hypothetical protein